MSDIDDLRNTQAKVEKVISLAAELIEKCTVFINDSNIFARAIAATMGDAGETLTAAKIQHLKQFIQKNLTAKDKDAKKAIEEIIGELCNIAGLEPLHARQEMQINAPRAASLLSTFNRKRAELTGTTNSTDEVNTNIHKNPTLK